MAAANPLTLEKNERLSMASLSHTARLTPRAPAFFLELSPQMEREAFLTRTEREASAERSQLQERRRVPPVDPLPFIVADRQAIDDLDRLADVHRPLFRIEG